MIENMVVVAGQVLMLFLMMAVGWLGAKTKLLTDAGADQLSKISLNIVTPCVIIHSLQRDRDPQLFAELGISIAAGVFAIALGMAVSYCFFRKTPDKDRRVLRFAMSYPNCGYMGIPLVQATLGEDAVVFAAAAVIALNLMVWTAGVMTMGGKSEISLKKAVLNPGILSFVVAFLLFGFGIRLPSAIGDAVSMFADMNTPIAMLAIGIFIASTKLPDCFRQGRLFLVSVMRLVAVPAVLVAVLYPLHLRYEVYAAAVITACAPTAAVTGMFSARYRLNTALSSQAVTLSTLLSILTMPVFAGLVQALV